MSENPLEQTEAETRVANLARVRHGIYLLSLQMQEAAEAVRQAAEAARELGQILRPYKSPRWTNSRKLPPWGR